MLTAAHRYAETVDPATLQAAISQEQVPELAGLRLDPQDTSPLYQQVARLLADRIRDGVYKADQALPSERTLSDVLEVSRVTARKAIDQLVLQGLIVRRRGSGNYIAPRLEQALTHMSGFSEELARRGFTPNSRWLARGIGMPQANEQLTLGLSPNMRVARLERLRLADNVVMAYETSVVPQAMLPYPERVDTSLYEYLGTSGYPPVRALQHIRALNAEAWLAELLNVPVGQAVLHITRISYLESGQAVELTHSYCHSDYYDFVAEMGRT